MFGLAGKSSVTLLEKKKLLKNKELYCIVENCIQSVNVRGSHIYTIFNPGDDEYVKTESFWISRVAG